MRFLKVVKFDFINILKNPTLVFCNAALPLILIGILGLVTKGSFGNAMSSFDYYGVSMIILCALLALMTATNTFMEERVKKANIRMVYTPVSKIEIYLSKIISSCLIGMLSSTITLLLGQYVFRINYGGANIIYIIALIDVLTLFSCSLGVMLCCLLKDEEKSNSIAQIPILFFSFFGGVFLSIYGLGTVVKAISNVSPVKWMMECVFQIIYDKNTALFLPLLIGLSLASVVCVIICQLTFRQEDYV